MMCLFSCWHSYPVQMHPIKSKPASSSCELEKLEAAQRRADFMMHIAVYISRLASRAT